MPLSCIFWIARYRDSSASSIWIPRREIFLLICIIRDTRYNTAMSKNNISFFLSTLRGWSINKFIVFYSVAVFLYFVLNWQVYSYGYPALEGFPLFQKLYTAWFCIISPLFVLARILERYFKNWFITFILWIWSFWLAMLMYLVLWILLLYISLYTANLFWLQLYDFHHKYHLFFGLFLWINSFIMSAVGWYNARHSIIRKLEYTFPKWSGKGGDFHIVAASDIHLGTIIWKKRFGRFVRDVNMLKPDAIFLVGDTIDEDIEPVIRQDIGSSIRKLHAPLWVFGINGNHEHIGGVERADAYLVEHGVQLLRDQFSVIADAFVLVGREDVSSAIFTGTPRMSLAELLADVPQGLPIILLDHQPSSVGETSADWRVALQLSWHTHHGQLWPFSWVTRSIFEISWGGKRINGTEFYVSSGWGTWGPPVRTGNTPEILDIRIRFE